MGDKNEGREKETNRQSKKSVIKIKKERRIEVKENE